MVREAVLVYSREIAFAAAQVYAGAAEARGAWDARVEALVVDAFVRGDLDTTVLGRVSALGWSGQGSILLVAGSPPAGEPELRRRVALVADDLTGANIQLTNPGGIGTIASVPRLMTGNGTIIATGRSGNCAHAAVAASISASAPP